MSSAMLLSAVFILRFQFYFCYYVIKPKVLKSSHYIQNLDISGNQIIEYINTKALSSKNSLWNSTLVDCKRVTKPELRLYTRGSFNSTDFFESVLKKRYREKSNPFESGLIASLIISVTSSVTIVPNLPGNDLRNAIGLTVLSLPFLYMGFATVFPQFLIKLPTLLLDAEAKTVMRERLCYHEAGHFIVGYLCGYPILSYEIDQNSQASLTIGFNGMKSIIEGGGNNPELLKREIGSLLAISMAGIVAESIKYGDAIGGAEDWPLSFAILEQYNKITKKPSPTRTIPVSRSSDGSSAKELIMAYDADITDEFLRGAALKALVLLRLHRDCLDRVAAAMSKGQSIYACIDAIDGLN